MRWNFVYQRPQHLLGRVAADWLVWLFEEPVFERMKERGRLRIETTLAAFDRIPVVDRGRVIEEGSPMVLRARGGMFERMWMLQTKGLARALDRDAV